MSRALTIGEAFALAEDLVKRGCWDDARTVCGRIVAADPRYAPALHLLGIAARRRGDRVAAIRFLQKAVASAPGFAAAFNDLGNLLMEEGRTAEAIAQYRQAIAIQPAYPEAHNNLGNACQIAGLLEDAVGCYRKALGLSPAYAEAYRNLGSALRRLGRLGEAVGCFRSAVSLNPRYADAITQLVQEVRSLCDWELVDALTAQLVEVVEARSAAVNPFVFLSLETTARQQFLCARRWAEEHLDVPGARPPARRAHARPGDRITLGYLSADFQEHATAHLTAELFALHDRSRFRVIGYSYGADDGSPMRRRLANTFDDFVDLETASHAQAAERIRNDGVDILVDLKGYTRDARPTIMAMRPAPIQVSYLGYPGTMGTNALDYIIADPFVVPTDQQPNYAESIVHLPDSYQANDSTRPIAERIPTRRECGLPESGFVFCCFNASYKFTPRVFDVWIRLLGAVPGSVLWILASNDLAAGNLKREAEARLAGSAGRLVFAPSLPNPEHLARFAVADLFLDTLPYNAHTLASDALWGGCPVITCSGETFPSRVAGSILRAAGLPELVTESLSSYEALALRLARDPGELGILRRRLQSNRGAVPLFDSHRFTRNLESAFKTIWRRHLAGEPPSPLTGAGHQTVTEG